MSILATGAFRRYVELFEELKKRKDAGTLTPEIDKRFKAALQTCWDGMSPLERAEVEEFVAKASGAIKAAQNQASFQVDTSQAPYTVPCPRCYAFALGPCMSKPREPTNSYPGMKFPADARVLPTPHPERERNWQEHPEWRVRAMK